MRGLNKVTLLGNLGRDPEVRYTQNGNAVANLAVATNERRKQGNDWKDVAEWHRVVCFGKTAEAVAKTLGKGSGVLVEGRLQTRQWEKDGAKQYITEVVANDIVFLGGGGRSSQREPRQEDAWETPQTSRESRPNRQTSQEDFNDDIPF